MSAQDAPCNALSGAYTLVSSYVAVLPPGSGERDALEAYASVLRGMLEAAGLRVDAVVVETEPAPMVELYGSGRLLLYAHVTALRRGSRGPRVYFFIDARVYLPVCPGE